MRFAHISDTHILRDNLSGEMGKLFSQLSDPKEKLSLVLEDIRCSGADFVLITGDMVHEGDAEDYRVLREILDMGLGDIPYFVALGNHDMKPAFYQGFLGEEPKESWHGIWEWRGLRIILADSAIPGSEHGSFTEEQTEFLVEALQSRSERGTLLAFHHPVLWSMKAFEMQIEVRLRSALQQSDVIGIFCGHTHENRMMQMNGLTQYVAGSTAFGLKVLGEEIHFTDQAEYLLYDLDEEGRISVHAESIWPKIDKRVRFQLKEFQAAMENLTET